MTFPPPALAARDDTSPAIPGAHAQDHTDERSAINTTVAELVAHELDQTAHGIPTQITTALAPYATSAAVAAGYQPLDSDLTALAALATTSFGRSVLTQADAAALRTLAGLGTAATQNTGAFDAAGAAAAAQAASQPLDSDLTAIAALTTTNFGRSILAMADASTVKTALALVKGDVGLSNVDNTADANKPVSTAQAAADATVLSTAEAYTDTVAAGKVSTSTALTTLDREWAGINIPFGSNFRIRGGYGPRSTTITGSLNNTDSTSTIALGNSRFWRGVNELVWLDPGTSSAEAVLITSATTCTRGQRGTSVVAHSAGATISRSRVRTVVGVGDSTLQDTQNSISAPYDAWFNRLRRKADERLGGVVGHGFYPIWRNGQYGANSGTEWTLSTSPSWATVLTTVTYDLGFHGNAVNCLGNTGATATFSVPAGMVINEIRVPWTDVSSNSVWTLTIDGGTPIANTIPTTHPSTPTHKKSVFNSSTTGWTQPASSIVITCTSASIIYGIEVYAQVITEGVTEGWAFHNCGHDGDTLAHLVQSRVIDDATVSLGSPTIVSSVRAAWTSHDKTVTLSDNGTVVTANIVSVSGNNATTDHTFTAAVNAGTPNPCVIHYGEGDWGRMLDGDPGSWVPDVVLVQFTNDMDVQTLTTPTGASTSAYTANATSNGTNVLTGAGTYTQVDVGKLIIKSDVPAGTTVTNISGTSITMSAAATGSSTSSTILGALEATVNFAVKQNLHTLCTRVAPYADVIIHIPFEQGSTRLTGAHCTSARQTSYRAALVAQAAAETNGGGSTGLVTVNLFDRWQKFGYANAASYDTPLLLDTGDSTRFHIGANGHRDIPEADLKVFA